MGELNQSEAIGNLAAALVKVQAKLKPAKMDAENPFFRSKYATLESCWNACRELLTQHELAVVQPPVGNGNDRIEVKTILIHTSGEWVSGTVSLKPTKDDPQAAGSAITYGRRYGLCCLVGVVPQGDDDDGNAASTKPKPKSKPKSKPNPQQRADKEAKPKTDGNGRRMNDAYIGGDDPTVTIPAVFKTKPKTGKSLIYVVDDKDVVFPIGQVKSQDDQTVEVTAWIADKKINDGELAPELVCYRGDAWEGDDNAT